MRTFAQPAVTRPIWGATMCVCVLLVGASPGPSASDAGLETRTIPHVAERACDPDRLDTDCPCGENVEDYEECRSTDGDEWVCDPASNGEWRFWVKYEHPDFDGSERICPWDEL